MAEKHGSLLPRRRSVTDVRVFFVPVFLVPPGDELVHSRALAPVRISMLVYVSLG